ncbi:unnamed protein product [Lactuca virosa]|uniref:Uncharacterized protein n=1 Tax=Lactuca virosa TaxID=75947 RepID=A0AAU9M219_9ASTR|nr:unnamed protein product [Lactuca virosa]
MNEFLIAHCESLVLQGLEEMKEELRVKYDEDVGASLQTYSTLICDMERRGEPASGARASILRQDYLPEGTVSQARAADVPGPTDTSSVSPSYGQNLGRKRKMKMYNKSSTTPASNSTERDTISRDPLAMRMREDQIKQIWGGDSVYPTVNYIQDPDQVIDFRGPDFHEPTPNILAYLQENGNTTSKEEIDKILASEKVKKVKDSDDEGKFEDDENITRNWSVWKTTPELRKSKVKETRDIQ